MKTLLILTIVTTMSIIAPAQSSRAMSAPDVSETSVPAKEVKRVDGKVISVENGDTITVRVRGQEQYSVKLQAIDAPDIGQPYFDDARKGLSRLILKRDVTIVVYTAYGKDMVIGTVLRGNRDVGLDLLEKGLAWHYTRFAYQQPSSERKSYADAQDYAVTAGLGLWSDERPTPPWVFRGSEKATIADIAETGANTPAGESRKYTLGPRGGCYYVAKSGGKVYVNDKSLCGVKTAENRP